MQTQKRSDSTFIFILVAFVVCWFVIGSLGCGRQPKSYTLENGVTCYDKANTICGAKMTKCVDGNEYWCATNYRVNY